MNDNHRHLQVTAIHAGPLPSPKQLSEYDKHILTSQNSPEVAQLIKQASAEILKKNYHLYKALENE